MILSAYQFADGVELAPDSIAACADVVRAGGLIGLVGGGTGSNIAQAAGVGAVIGAAGGGYMGNKAQEDIVKKCLSGRGYKVLD